MATNEIRIILRAINQASKVFKDVEGDATKSFQSMAIEAAKAGAILAAFATTVKMAYDFGKEGAQIERLRESGTQFAKSFGVDMDEAVAKIKAASKGTVSANTAVLQANRAMMLGVAKDSDTMAKLVEIAAIRGRLAGLSTEEAFDRITLGIGRLSTRILDDIGIVVDGETAYANFGKAIGKSADDLTEAQKREALAIAIIEDGNKILAQTGGLVEDNASRWEQLEVHVIDFTNTLKELVAGPTGNVILALDRLLFGVEAIDQALVEHRKIIALSAMSQSDYEKELQRLSIAEDALRGIMAATTGIIETRNRATEQASVFTQNLTESERNQIRENYARLDAEKKLRDALLLRKQAEDELYKSQQKAIDQFEELRSTAEDFSMDDALKSVLEFASGMGISEGAIAALEQQYSLAFGKISESVMDFMVAIELAAADGVITLEEFTKAFDAVKMEQAAQKVIDAWDKADAKIKELRDEFEKDVLDSEKQLADDMLDAATKRDRDLADLEEKNNQDRDEAIAEANKKRWDDEEAAESAHQKRIQKILRKFFYSRIQALMDADARALWEAELTRDQELQDAEEDRKQKREDDEKALKDKIDDIQGNYDERRDEIQKQYDRDIEDAKENDRRRQRDLQDALDDELAIQDQAKRMEKEKQEQFLSDRVSTEKLDYQQRISDLIGYWQSVAFINDFYRGLPTGGPPLSDIPEEGGVPNEGGWSPPIGTDWGDEDIGANNIAGYTPTTETGARADGVGQNIVVTLNVTGDGLLANAVRQAALSAVVDVIAE